MGEPIAALLLFVLLIREIELKGHSLYDTLLTGRNTLIRSEMHETA